MKALRGDLIFSYWIYVWYLFYIFNYTSYNPKFALMIGLIDNIIMLILMLYYNTPKRTLLIFVLVNTLIKVVPLYYLRKDNDAVKWKDIYFTCILFIIFVLWLHLNKQNLVGNVKMIYDSLLYGKDKTPVMALINKIEKHFKNIQIF
jgi:hypothetical protein